MRRQAVVLGPAVAVAVIAGALTVTAAGGQEDAAVTGLNQIGPEELPAVTPEVDLEVTDEVYRFTVTPGIETGGGNLAALGQSWVGVNICPDPGLPFARAPERADVAGDGEIRVVHLSRSQDETGCWELRLGQRWTMEEGFRVNNPEHEYFRNLGFPFPDLHFIPPETVTVTVPHGGVDGVDGAVPDAPDAAAEVVAGRVVDRGVALRDETLRFVGRAGANRFGVQGCRWEYRQTADYTDDADSGVWLRTAQVTSTEFEVPLAWAEAGMTWQDMGHADSLTVTITGPDGQERVLSVPPEFTEPRLVTDSANARLPAQRVLASLDVDTSGHFASDVWLEPGTVIEMSSDLAGRCLDPEELGPDGVVSDRDAWSHLNAQVIVARPAEETTVSLDSGPREVGPAERFPGN